LGVCASNVQVLTPENFDQIVGKGKPALVEFYAPWCGHCKNLEPKYEQLADAFQHAQDKVIIAKVDADGEGKPLGQKYGVTGFPTLKWFKAEGGEPENYEQGRELESLTEFITTKTGIKSKIPPKPVPAVLVLNAHTFDEVALDKSKHALVAFTAPWCGHCKNMKPVFETVASIFKPESDCVVANVDADSELNKPLATKYGVSSYPSLMFFSKDNKEEPETYEGGRTEEDFVAYLNEKCDTQRAVGGGLNDKAGRHPTLDDLASRFLDATSEVRQSILAEASKVSSEIGTTSKHYLRVMEKLVDGSEAYLNKELQRLKTILGKKTLAQSKVDELKRKYNVLNAFVKEVVDEVTGRADDEL
jgi:protein disulfide-isomerase A6